MANFIVAVVNTFIRAFWGMLILGAVIPEGVWRNHFKVGRHKGSTGYIMAALRHVLVDGVIMFGRE